MYTFAAIGGLIPGFWYRFRFVFVWFSLLLCVL